MPVLVSPIRGSSVGSTEPQKPCEEDSLTEVKGTGEMDRSVVSWCGWVAWQPGLALHACAPLYHKESHVPIEPRAGDAPAGCGHRSSQRPHDSLKATQIANTALTGKPVCPTLAKLSC